MRNFTVALIAGCGVLAAASMAAAQAAQKPDQVPRFEETLVVTATPKPAAVSGAPSDYFLTFSGPVGVPGVTLAAGTYLFRFPVGPGAGVIQVLKADSSNAYAMFMTIPVQDATRGPSSDALVVMWKDRLPGAAPAIKEWYLPGRSHGYEFIYPKNPT